MTALTMRRSQTLSPFGVGAILDVMGESLVAEDISRWRDGTTTAIEARRLAALLRVDDLRMAPATSEKYPGANSPGVPYFRFPQWLFCGTCRRMYRWSTNEEEFGKAPACKRCTGIKRKRQLVPMRWVMVCGNGHLDDVDWIRWAHRGAGSNREVKQCQKPDLRFEHVSGVGGGLESIRVRCVTCKGPGVTLKGIGTVKFDCRGKQPWQFSADGPCIINGERGKAVVVQRGASNVHFPKIASAIDIPPDSDWESWGSNAVRIRNHDLFKGLLSQQEKDDFWRMLVDKIATDLGVTAGEVEAVAGQQAGAAAPGRVGAVDEDGETALRTEEYLAFLQPKANQDYRDRFITRHVDLRSGRGPAAHSALAGLVARLDALVLVTRLREVRALWGFGRYEQLQIVPVDLGKGLKWLPAVENYGEGLFFTLAGPSVAAWEKTPAVIERTRVVAARHGTSFQARWLAVPTPRLMLLHTLAHLLIRQLTYSAGYSSAALRERIYSAVPADGSSGMAGMLIYTAAGDAQGTLGGLVRQGEPTHLLPGLVVALQQAQWCSLDPICRESTGQGTDSLSLAACHACALVSETSCEHSNVLLDRALLIDPDFGFFGPVMDELAAWQTEVMV